MLELRRTPSLLLFKKGAVKNIGKERQSLDSSAFVPKEKPWQRKTGGGL